MYLRRPSGVEGGFGMSQSETHFPCNSRVEQKLRGRKMYETLKTFKREYFQVLSHRYHQYINSILPPDSLNLGKNPCQSDSSFFHPLSVNVKPPLILACVAICDNHLSTSTHGSSKGSVSSQSGFPIVIDVNAGAEPMEHRMFTRQGEGLIL